MKLRRRRTDEPKLVIPKLQILGQTGYLCCTLPEDTPADMVKRFAEQIADSDLPAERVVIITGAKTELVEDIVHGTKRCPRCDIGVVPGKVHPCLDGYLTTEWMVRP